MTRELRPRDPSQHSCDFVVGAAVTQDVTHRVLVVGEEAVADCPSAVRCSRLHLPEKGWVTVEINPISPRPSPNRNRSAGAGRHELPPVPLALGVKRREFNESDDATGVTGKAREVQNFVVIFSTK